MIKYNQYMIIHVNMNLNISNNTMHEINIKTINKLIKIVIKFYEIATKYRFKNKTYKIHFPINYLIHAIYMHKAIYSIHNNEQNKLSIY